MPNGERGYGRGGTSGRGGSALDTILDTLESMNDRLAELEDRLDSMEGGQGFVGEYDEEEGGREFRGGDMDIDEDRLARIKAIQRHGSGRNLPTYGPESGEGPQGRRAFSATRDRGGREEIDGVSVPIDKSGTIDERTREGRLLTDDRGVDEQELEEFLDKAPRNKDGSVDLRTEMGRALRAANWVDENGWPNEDMTGGEGDFGDEGEDESRGGMGASSGGRRQGRGQASRGQQPRGGRRRMHQGGS